jgi:shikimate kinase
MILTLIGYRGTGKTSLAEPLAERLGWVPVDADVEIEGAAECSIREIFEEGGEETFRKLEREVIADLLKQENLVLAAGGGAILNRDTRRDFVAAGPVVWLKASAETIDRRLHGDETTTERRPNLTSSGGLAEIEELLAVREPLYRETASLIVTTDEPLPGDAEPPTPERLADYILERLADQLNIAETQPC